MSTGVILTVLSNIPWGQVVENAPKIADGAASLWNTVTSFRKSAESAEKTAGPVSSKTPSETEVLRSQIKALEGSVKNLHEQMQASSELIKVLAEQNTQLVKRIELNRVRFQRVSIAGMCAGLLLLTAVAYLLVRQ